MERRILNKLYILRNTVFFCFYRLSYDQQGRSQPLKAKRLVLLVSKTYLNQIGVSGYIGCFLLGHLRHSKLPSQIARCFCQLLVSKTYLNQIGVSGYIGCFLLGHLRKSKLPSQNARCFCQLLASKPYLNQIGLGGKTVGLLLLPTFLRPTRSLPAVKSKTPCLARI